MAHLFGAILSCWFRTLDTFRSVILLSVSCWFSLQAFFFLLYFSSPLPPKKGSCLGRIWVGSTRLVCSFQICPGLNANEMHVLYDRHHKVSSSIKVHQNTPNSFKYEVIWKCETTQSNIKYLLNNTCVQSWT